MNRRGFLGSILALGAAPAIVRADSLMRIIPRDTIIGMGDEASLWVVDNLVYDGPLIVETDWTLIQLPAGFQMYGTGINVEQIRIAVDAWEKA